MNENPYAIHDDTIAAAHAPVDARVQFLKKTYTLLLAAILTFSGTMWVAGFDGPIREMVMAMSGINPLLYFAIFIGGAILVHAVAEKPLGIFVFFGFAFVWGLLSAPLILGVAQAAPHVLTQAAIVTALIFTGLTAYVFKSGKDFAFLGGILAVSLWALFGIAIAGWLFGFGLGLWFSVAGAIVFAGYILYDTSNILHRYSTNMHVSAAMVLFVDVVILFKNLIFIFLATDD